MPKISVVMPVYNGEEFLADSIDSILNQTMDDYEFIIVLEAGSNPESCRILEDYAARCPKIRIIENSERLGISESLNVGIRAANGEYIARMDGDDLSGPRRFEIQSAFMDRYPEIGACGIVHTVINAPHWIVDYSTDPEIVKSACMFAVPMRHPTIMVRREVMMNGCMYNGALPGAEDYDLFLRLSLAAKITNLREPSLFQYRITGSNASLQNKERDNAIIRNTMQAFIRQVWNIEMNPLQLEGLDFTNMWHANDTDHYCEVLRSVSQLLSQIIVLNHSSGIYKDYALMESFRHKWRKIYTHLSNANNKHVPNDITEVYQHSMFYQR